MNERVHVSFFGCRDIIWRGETAVDDELRFDFTSIIVSAIASYGSSGDAAKDGRKCLYLQIDSGDDCDIEEVEGDCDEGAMDREVHVFFEENDQLDQAFQAMCDGALRNPDSDVGEEEGGGGFFFDADSMVMGDAFDRSVDLQEWYVIVQGIFCCQ